jgi:DNA-directed RNA polymerase delta subunit
VLKKYEEPLHFRKITDYINLHWSNKEALSQTVHNELIKDDRFVLVGRGIYGLTEWGLSGGTVREIIIGLMKDEQGPLDKDVIVTHVLGKKKVKEMTVLVNLANQGYFNKDEEGRYFIKV